MQVRIAFLLGTLKVAHELKKPQKHTKVTTITTIYG